jgi:hypothetical protein
MGTHGVRGKSASRGYCGNRGAGRDLRWWDYRWKWGLDGSVRVGYRMERLYTVFSYVESKPATSKDLHSSRVKMFQRAEVPRCGTARCS